MFLLHCDSMVLVFPYVLTYLPPFTHAHLLTGIDLGMFVFRAASLFPALRKSSSNCVHYLRHSSWQSGGVDGVLTLMGSHG